MDYGRLISRSFQLAWRYKSLWIFGLFAGFGSTFNVPSDFPGFRVESMESLRAFNWDAAHAFEGSPVFLSLVLAFLGLMVVFLIAHLIASPALVDAVNKIARGGLYRFGDSFSAGVDFFWRFLGLLLLEILAFIVSIIPFALVILVIPLLGILLAIPGAFVLIFVWNTIFELARRVIVARDCSIGDALSEGFLLMKQHLSKTIVIFVLIFFLGMAFLIAAAIMWLVVGLPIGGIVWAMTQSVAAGAVMAILFGLPVSLVVGGYFGTFFSSLYTLFYFELVEPSGSRIPPAAQPGPSM